LPAVPNGSTGKETRDERNKHVAGRTSTGRIKRIACWICIPYHPDQWLVESYFGAADWPGVLEPGCKAAYYKNMKFILFFCGLLAVGIATAIFAKPPPPDEKSGALNNAVILVIRHAEKPAKGPDLNAAGEARAAAYVDYLKNFTMDGKPLKLDYLFAAADSKESNRAHQTIEPTSKSLGLSIDSRFEDAQFAKLADEIRTQPHGQNMLVCWHHGEIPQLVKALGADPNLLFPKGKWPDEVFNWVIALRYNADGRLFEAKRINEPF
jgi:hypothetical protein